MDSCLVIVFVALVCPRMTSSADPPSPNPEKLVAKEGESSVESVSQGCPDAAEPCIWMCCPDDHILDESYECTPGNGSLPPPRATGGSFGVLHGNPCPHQRYNLEPDEPYRVDENGSLIVLMDDGDTDFDVPAGDFCLAVFERAGSTHTLPVVCLTEEEYGEEQALEGENLSMWLYSLGMIVSLPFLMATIAVYAIVPELYNLHGKCLISHVTSLTVAYVFLIVIKLLGRDVLSHSLCVASALMAYFFLLAVFFWLNVMCFDIWWTFSGYRAVVGPKGVSSRNQFWFYSLYGWGVPILMLGACAINDFVPELPDYIVKPMLGEERCWFEGALPLLVYFYGPVGVLITANIVMFVTTNWKILQIKKETAILSIPDNRRSDEDRQNRQRFVLYFKLFVVMGVSWSLEPISWWVGGPIYIWWFTDLLNSLKGVIIFLIFVWKPKVRLLVARRFKLGNMGLNSSSRTK